MSPEKPLRFGNLPLKKPLPPRQCRSKKPRDEREANILRHQKIVTRIAFHLRNAGSRLGLEISDLMQEGCFGLLTAAKTVNSRKGSYAGHARWKVLGVITQCLKESTGGARAMHEPANLIEQLRQLHALDNEYYTLHGTEPPMSFLTRRLGGRNGRKGDWSEEHIRLLRLYGTQLVTWLDAQVETDEEGGRVRVQDRLADAQISALQRIEADEELTAALTLRNAVRIMLGELLEPKKDLVTRALGVDTSAEPLTRLAEKHEIPYNQARTLIKQTERVLQEKLQISCEEVIGLPEKIERLQTLAERER